MTTRKPPSARAPRTLAVAFALALLPWRALPAASLPELSVPRSSRFT